MPEFTGERVIPGAVDPDLLNEHLARYAFAERVCRGKRVLDAGCGTGYGAAELARTAASVVGVDISAEAIAFARAHYSAPNLSFLEGSCSSLPHGGESFDLVVAFEVIEHLKDWRECLAEMRRVLAASGQLIVSTPNKLYYSEARGAAGPNPFHHHEFDFAEFRAELSAVFPAVEMFLENHAEGIVFRPLGQSAAAEARLGQGAAPQESHFFVAVCAKAPQSSLPPAFVYLPSSANILKTRESHIALLESEVSTKNTWLEQMKTDLAELNRLNRALHEDLESRTRWARELQREQSEAQLRIVELQNESLQQAQAGQRIADELETKCRELAHCVELLDRAEKTVEERTVWAQSLHAESELLKHHVALLETSGWTRLGRKLGLAPVSPKR